MWLKMKKSKQEVKSAGSNCVIDPTDEFLVDFEDILNPVTPQISSILSITDPTKATNMLINL